MYLGRIMPVLTVASPRCFFCNDCQSGSSNVTDHCKAHHTDIDELIGLSLAGYRFRRLDEDHPNILVAIKGEGNPRNVMYCLECNATRIWKGVEPRDASKTFSCHKCDKRGESKLKGRILSPTQMATTGGGSAAAPSRGDGIWLDESIYAELRTRFPAMGLHYITDDTGKFNAKAMMLSLAAAAQRLDDIVDKPARDAKVGSKAKKAAATGDPWSDVASLFYEDEELSTAYESLVTGATNVHTTEMADWKLAMNKDALKRGVPLPFEDVDMDDADEEDVTAEELVMPDSNINRSVIRDAVRYQFSMMNRKRVGKSTT